MNSKLKSIYLGQAIGDALGLATEFMTKEEIAIHYPNGIKDYNDIYQDDHRSRWSKGFEIYLSKQFKNIALLFLI